MKKSVMLVVAIVILSLAVAAVGHFAIGNRQLIDLTNKFNRVIVLLPNGDLVDGKVLSWLDYDDCDQIQVNIDGTTYLVHNRNVALISE